MERDLAEVIGSQDAMLQRLGQRVDGAQHEALESALCSSNGDESPHASVADVHRETFLRKVVHVGTGMPQAISLRFEAPLVGRPARGSSRISCDALRKRSSLL